MRPARLHAQVDLVVKLDNALRDEMVQVQASVSRWITEQKQVADGVVVQAQRTLEMDKGALICVTLARAASFGLFPGMRQDELSLALLLARVQRIYRGCKMSSTQ